MWTDTHSDLRRNENQYWQKATKIVITGRSSLYFQVCPISLQILSTPGLALNHENMILKKLWEIKIITKKATQVGHLQNERSKTEGPKVSYTGLKLMHMSKNLLNLLKLQTRSNKRTYIDSAENCISLKQTWYKLYEVCEGNKKVLYFFYTILTPLR